MTITTTPQFFKVDPRGSHVAPLPGDAATAPTTLLLSDLGLQAGDIVFLDQTGDFNPGSSDSPFDDQEGLVAVFTGPNGPVATTGTNFRLYDRGLVDGNLQFNDIDQDFFVQPEGVTVVVPAGATALLFATTDAYKGPNSDPDGDFGVLLSLAPAGTFIPTDGPDIFNGTPAMTRCSRGAATTSCAATRGTTACSARTGMTRSSAATDTTVSTVATATT